MQVLMVTPVLPYPQAPSGGALVIYSQLRALAQRHTVTLATFAGPDLAEQTALDALRAEGFDVHAVWRREPFGVRRWQRRWRFARGWLRGTHPLRALEFREPAMQQVLDRLQHDRRFDLIQVEDNAMAQYRYPTHVPRVLTEHEVRLPALVDRDSSTSLVQRVLGALEWHRWRRYQAAVWQRFDRIQVFTPRDAAALGALVPPLREQVHINPFGVTLPRSLDPGCEEDGHIVFVGGFAHPPNVDAALWLGHEILPLLRVLRPGVRLTIVGSQPPPVVQALASADCVVTGRVPSVEPYLERATVMIAPLRVGGGMRVKVLEAMAYGKAVVTTSLGAEGVAAHDHQPPLLVADNARALAHATALLLRQPAARRTLGRRARAFVAEHHSWAAYGQRLEAVYAAC